jgi:hypothetical protein
MWARITYGLFPSSKAHELVETTCKQHIAEQVTGFAPCVQSAAFSTSGECLVTGVTMKTVTWSVTVAQEITLHM